MALGSIVIDLLLKTGAFETDTKKAERRLREMEKTAKRVGAAIGTAIVGGVTAATYAIRSQIQAMDDLSKAALRAHMPTEEFSQLAYAGSLADVEMGNLVTSMGRLARAQADAQRGLATQTDAFRKLGIEFEDANGKMRSGMDVLKDFADVVQNRRGDPEVLAAGMQVFGRSFQNLIPLLSQGRAGLEAAADEADRLGITLGTEAGRQAEEFNDNLTRLQTGIQGVWRAVAADLLPDLVRLTDEMVRGSTEGGRLSGVAQDIADGLRGIGSVIGVVVDAMRVVSGTVRGVMHDLIAMGNAADAGWRALRGDWSGAAGALRNMLVAREMAADASADIAKVFEGSGPPDLSPVFAGEGEPAGLFRMSEAEVLAERARKAAEEAAEAARKEAEARAKAAEAAAKGARARAEAERELAEAIREAEEAERAMTLAMMESEQRKIDWLNRIDDMVARAEGPAAMAVLTFRRELAELNAALAVGDISMQDYQRAAQALGQTLGDVVAEVDVATGEMTVFAEQAARNIQSFLGDATYDLLDGKFRDIADSFSDMIKRMLAELAASKLLDMLAQIGKNNSGTWWGSILGGLSGTRASGGNVASGGTYLVGERGPELLRMGPNSGTIVPNHALGGGGVRVQVINNGPPVQAQASSETQPDGTQLVRLVLNEVASDIASGGVVARAGKSRFGWKEQV